MAITAQSRVLLGALTALCACSGAAAPPRLPEPPAESAPAAPAPPAVTPAPVAPAVVPNPPTACQQLSEHRPGCFVEGADLAAIERALTQSSSALRDLELAKLQTCEAFAPGLVLALRMDAAPVECGDAIAGRALPAGARREVEQLLTAQVHAAHLRRLVVAAPRLDPPFTKQDFAEFSKTVLNDWVVTQAQAIYKIAEQGSELSGYARGVVAVEAGLSDMRFVSVARDVPLPEEMDDDEELREAYYSELDNALTPWKTRGRDAALVGLREFAAAGVLADARVSKARRLLSELYGGRPIDKLDGLILPELPSFEPRTLEERLAARLPTPIFALLMPDIEGSEARVLRALLERGISPSLRADLESRPLDPASRALLARALIGLGQLYWRAADFEAALSVLGRGGDSEPLESRLLRGLAEALENGPQDAADMMLRGPRLPAGVGNTALLDQLAAGDGPLAGAAAFNAAYLLEMVPPAGDPGFWRDLSERYRRASLLLPERDKQRALERADAAEATARALVP